MNKRMGPPSAVTESFLDAKITVVWTSLWDSQCDDNHHYRHRRRRNKNDAAPTSVSESTTSWVRLLLLLLVFYFFTMAVFSCIKRVSSLTNDRDNS